MKCFVCPVEALDYAKQLLDRRRFIVHRKPHLYKSSMQIVKYKNLYWTCNPSTNDSRYLMSLKNKKPTYGKIIAEIYRPS